MAEASTQTPTDKPPYADVLSNVGRPSLSAQSDMPSTVQAKAVDETSKAPDSADTSPGAGDASASTPLPSDGSASGEGEAPAEPTKPASEGGDTPAWQKARITAEANKRRAAEQRATQLETQLSQALKAIEKLTGDPEKPKEDNRPSRESFDTPDAYDAALEEWAGRRAADKAVAEAQAQQLQQDRERQQEAIRTTFDERRASFEADHPDFEDVVYSDDLKISVPMTAAILEAEDGPAIAYYLGQNPEVAERIAGLSPAKAVYEIGRISTKLANPPKPKPEPIKPLNVRNTSGPKDPNEMSMAEYASWRAEQRKTS